MTGTEHDSTPRPMALIAACALISACAGTPKNAAPRSIPHGTPIHLVGADAVIETPNARSAGETVAAGSAAGAAAGAAYGAGAGFVMGFACGPLFIVCSPVGAVGGIAGGAIFGAAVGGVGGAMTALPKQKAEALETIMAATIADHGGSHALIEEFEQQSDGRWILADAGAPVEISLGVERLSIDQGKNDTLTVSVTSWMAVSHGSEEREAAKRMPFTHVSRQHHIDDLIEGDGAGFQAVVQEGLTRNIAEMLRVLEGLSTRPR